MTEQIEQVGEADLIAPFNGQLRHVLATDDADTVAQKIDWMEAFKEWSKRVIAQMNEAAKEWIIENKPVQVGQTLYWAAPVKKDPKCIHLKTAIEKLLEACGGDIEKLAEHISSDGIKYGAASKTLDKATYESLWIREEPIELLSDDAAKARKRLQKAPAQFLKGRN